MRYGDSFEKSAEYLRLALPLMSRQDAALHPLSYAVWYEFVAGINPALKAVLEEMAQQGKKLDDTTTAELYYRHIAEVDAEVAQRISHGFQRVLAEIAQTAAATGDRAGHYGNALEKWVDSIGDSPEWQERFAGLVEIVNDTRQMQGAILTLARRLDDSRHEIEELRQEVSKARADALADALTGLSNRKGFDLAMQNCLAAQEAAGRGPSLLVLDIDHFKQVNDDFGHLFGDKVLRSVAQILKDNVKGKDTAARYGGEEFVILLPDTPIEGARALADTIRASVERCRVRRADNREAVGNVTVSLGVACYRPGESVIDFLGRADQALYASKHAGRNRVTLAVG